MLYDDYDFIQDLKKIFKIGKDIKIDRESLYQLKDIYAKIYKIGYDEGYEDGQEE